MRDKRQYREKRIQEKKKDLLPSIAVENAGVVANKMDELPALART